MTENQFITIKKLAWLKTRAKRCGVWFEKLSRIDRALVNLTIEVADKVRSFKLVKQLLSVMTKMEDALNDKVSQAMKRIGFPTALRLSLLAQKWGNNAARNWVTDISFAKFLAIMYVNNHQSSGHNL
jgi:hypothetical protein